MKCLYELSVEKLNDLVENELYLKDWVVWNADLKKRDNSAQYASRYERIQKQAEVKHIKHIPNEAITWFDSLTMLYHSLNIIEDEELKNNLKIFQEFCMPYSKKRADYLLTYDNKILILEFSFNNKGQDNKYETKLRQASSYKEILSVFLPKEIDIGTYTFLIAPEEDEKRKPVYNASTKKRVNDDKVEELAKVIVKFFKKNLKSAYISLMNLDYGDEKADC